MAKIILFIAFLFFLLTSYIYLKIKNFKRFQECVSFLSLYLFLLNHKKGGKLYEGSTQMTCVIGQQ